MYLSKILRERIGKYLFLFSLWTAVVSHRSNVARPKGVHFSSMNLKNVVKWHHGEDSPNDTHYMVEYAIYGDMVDGGGRKVHWRVKKECVDIPQTWCDLSNETTDLDENYFARVKAVGTNISSRWTLTDKRFDPKADTIFGPPHVKLVVKENRAKVRLKGPMRWKTGNLTKEYSMLKFFPGMTYSLFVYDNRSNQTRHFPLKTKSFECGLLTYETQYCFSAKAQYLTSPSHASEWECLTTPRDPFYDQLLLMVMGVAVPSLICLFILLIIGCLAYHFICGTKQQSPSFLAISNIPKPQQTFCPEQAVTVNVILVNMAKPSTVPALIHQPDMAPLLPYAAHQAPDREESPEEPWERDLWQGQPETLDYGFVGAEMPEIRETKASDIEETLPLGLSQSNPYVAQKCASRSQEPLDNIVFTGICLERDPETGLFRIPLPNLGGEGKGYKEPDQVQSPYAPQCLSVSETPERDLWEEKADDPQIYPSDCGFVGSIPEQQVGTSEYLMLSDRRDTEPPQLLFPEESEEEDEGGNCVDWSPTTGILQIPLLSQTMLEVEVGREKDTESEQMEILPSVIVRQSSEESEGESDLTKLQNVWNLQIMEN
ncbi:interleukin-20 receptor subunit alpha [Esox lucius]|uniref:Fibronectin type-III domain-containing protein n=1 Tax=Esox lucius TaxID=8010 RepID=A0A3P8YX85_ESOLU|nr:interleukin-20 receptor subunit alpha [Esox lucius]